VLFHYQTLDFPESFSMILKRIAKHLKMMRRSSLTLAKNLAIKRIKLILVLLQLPIVAFFISDWNLQLKRLQWKKDQGEANTSFYYISFSGFN
jgi:hypothetical protein